VLNRCSQPSVFELKTAFRRKREQVGDFANKIASDFPSLLLRPDASDRTKRNRSNGVAFAVALVVRGYCVGTPAAEFVCRQELARRMHRLPDEFHSPI